MPATDLDMAERHRRILELARQAGSVSVERLAGDLGVTPQTIRKDLNLLARRSMLSRVHGGAVITSGVDNIAYDTRRLVAAETKSAIGAAAAALIPDGASLFINIGTTTEAVARHLVHHGNLLLISNNLNVADMMAPFRSIETVVVGGRVRHDDRAVVGPLAVEFIRNFKVDFAVIGASALDLDGAFLDFDINEVEVARTIIRHARQVILVVDSSKIGRPAPVRIGDLTDLDYIVIDQIADQSLLDACLAAGVKVVKAG